MRKIVLKRLSTQEGAAPGPQPGTTVVIGVDLSSSKWVYCLRWDGAEQRRLSTPGKLEHLQALVREYAEQRCPVVVAYEACGFGYEIAWWCRDEGQTVIVVAPSTIEQAPGRQVKTDSSDAGGLAFKADKGLLKSIFVPERGSYQWRQLSRTYSQVLSDRRRQQSRLRLMLQEHGVEAPARTLGWSALEAWLAQASLPQAVRACVGELCTLRQAANAAAQRQQDELRKVARRPEYTQLVSALTAQPGVGRFTAIRFILEMGSMARFATADSLSNFLGLTPYEYSSGAIVHRGHVRKCGPGHVRTWLVQCAWAAIRSGRDQALNDCFERIAARGGRKRAIIAVARRLALRLRARWIEFERQALERAA